MKKYIVLFLLLITTSIYGAEFKKDIALTDGVWIDSRAYTSFATALSSVPVNKTIMVNKAETVSTSTHTSAGIDIGNSGSITVASGQTLTIYGPVNARPKSLLGSGNYVFAQGTTLRASWFADLQTAIKKVHYSNVTLIIDISGTISGFTSTGTGVTLKWESPGNVITSSSGSLNITGYIEAGNYKLFDGAGDFDFVSGTLVRSSWFDSLYIMSRYLSNNTVNLEIDKTETLDHSVTLTANTSSIIKFGTTITTGANTLTFNGPISVYGSIVTTGGSFVSVGTFQAPNKQIISGTGTISISDNISSRWIGTSLDTIVTNIGSTSTTLIIDSAITMTNDTTIPTTLSIEVKKPGSIAIPNGKTLTINGPFAAGKYQVFSCTGTGKVTIRDIVYPEWWGAYNDGTNDTATSTAIEKALLSGTYGVLHFSKGTYLVARAIQIPSGWNLEGDGRLSSIIYRTNTTPETLDSVSTLTVLYIDGTWVNIEDLQIKGVVTSIDGITFSHGGPQSHVNINRVEVAYCLNGVKETVGLFLTTFNDVNIQQCENAFVFNSVNGKTSLQFNDCYASSCGQPWDFQNTVYSSLNNCAADWANWGDTTPNPSGAAYGNPDTSKGIYNFTNACSIVLNGCGAESSYGNGVVSVSSSFITINNFTSYSCRSTFVPSYGSYTDYGVGPIQTGLTWCNLIVNNVYNYDWHNTVVDTTYPTKPVATMVAFNYDEGTYGTEDFLMVFIPVSNMTTAGIIDGMGNSSTYCSYLYHLVN